MFFTILIISDSSGGTPHRHFDNLGSGDLGVAADYFALMRNKYIVQNFFSNVLNYYYQW